MLQQLGRWLYWTTTVFTVIVTQYYTNSLDHKCFVAFLCVNHILPTVPSFQAAVWLECTLVPRSPFPVSRTLWRVSLWQAQGLWNLPQPPCRRPIVFILDLWCANRGRLDVNVLLCPALPNRPWPRIITPTHLTSAVFSRMFSFSSFISYSISSPLTFSTLLPLFLLSSSVNVQKALTLAWALDSGEN